jgi:hypothetical protein
MTDLQIISRDEARRAGLKRYFTGEPCQRGHVDEQYVAQGKCVECHRLEMRERYWKDPKLRIQKAQEWYEANKVRKAAYNRKYRKEKSSSFFYHRRHEQEAGRPRPDVCELCTKPNQINRPIYWDHCHKTGKFRGWLCHRCNTILAKVDDSPEFLRKMADYLEGTNPVAASVNP